MAVMPSFCGMLVYKAVTSIVQSIALSGNVPTSSILRRKSVVS